jgi:dienelactone hydrolase
MRKMKIAGIVLLCLGLLVVVALTILKVSLDASYFKGYDGSAPLEASVTDVTEKPSHKVEKLYFNGFHGDRVPTLLLTPNDVQRPMPCVIFLHGIGQDKDFITEEFHGKTVADPFLNAGFAFVTFDQFMRGERRIKSGSFWDEAKAFRARPVYTVNDTRRLIDYLQTRSDIAKNRIYLAGASYGAITGSTVAAFDTRVRAVVLTYGGGNLPKMLTARMIADEVHKRHIPLSLIQFAGWYLFSASDPARYIHQIAPRAVFLQNGINDGLIATEAAQALQDAALQPKVVKWYAGDHIGLDEKTVFIVLDDIIAFLREQDAKITAAEPAPKPSA